MFQVLARQRDIVNNASFELQLVSVCQTGSGFPKVCILIRYMRNFSLRSHIFKHSQTILIKFESKTCMHYDLCKMSTRINTFIFIFIFFCQNLTLTNITLLDILGQKHSYIIFFNANAIQSINLNRNTNRTFITPVKPALHPMSHQLITWLT